VSAATPGRPRSSGSSRPGTVAAIDIGATSGRVILGRTGHGELGLRQVARFPNDPVRLRDGLHWDLVALYRGVLDGLAAAVRASPDLVSAGIDTWGVDYGLLRDGRMLGAPYHYRDDRNEAGVAAVHAVIGPSELYQRNGLQHLPFNTIFQLACDRSAGLLDLADAMLLIPDLLGYQLTGAVVAERTNASTTGLLDVRTGEWDRDLAGLAGLPQRLLPPLVDPGTPLGRLSGDALSRAGAAVSITAVGSHDTASAVAAIPNPGDAFAYVSCGTWGLAGVELDRPVLTQAARAAGFTNEGGVDGRVRFLRNVMGLWLLSESIRSWETVSGSPGGGSAARRSSVLQDLVGQAGQAEGPVPLFDVNDPRFLAPGDIPARIAGWCREHGEPVPGSRAELFRSVIESLAQAFADATATAAELSGTSVSVIHLVGGGSRNRLLCQATADRSGLPVVAGPAEATAIGNVLVQARAAGLVPGSLEALRALVATSVRLRRYQPRNLGAFPRSRPSR
jgi:rhamnulokinase